MSDSSATKQFSGILLLILFTVQLSSQKSFIITASNDTIHIDKVLQNYSDEDGIIYKKQKERIALSAEEVLSYYDEGRVTRIQVEDAYKLVKILINLDVKFAVGQDKFRNQNYYIFYAGHWKALDAHKRDINTYLYTTIPQLNEANDGKRISYSMKSIGNALLKYNAFINKDIRIYSEIKYTERFQTSLTGSASISFIDSPNRMVIDGGQLNGFTFGASGLIRYNRYFFTTASLLYNHASRQNTEWNIKLSSLSLGAAINSRVLQKKGILDLSIGIGAKVHLGINSTIDYPTQPTLISSELEQLEIENLWTGIYFLVENQFNNNLGVRVRMGRDYTITSDNFGVFNSERVIFNMNTFALGLFYRF